VSRDDRAKVGRVHIDDLGFRGLLAAGYTADEAWAMIRETSALPEVHAIIAELGRSEEGRAALQWSREQWAEHGLVAPWDFL